MLFQLAAILSLASTLALAGPSPAPTTSTPALQSLDPSLEGSAPAMDSIAPDQGGPSPIAEVATDAAVGDSALVKRGNRCRVFRDTACYNGPATSYGVSNRRPLIYTHEQFGVSCTSENTDTSEDTDVGGNTTWDMIPRWGCWVPAYYTRAAGGQWFCEYDVPACTVTMPALS